jgi:hypothetical protein
MFAVITKIKTEDGGVENSWSIHDTKEEAKTAYELELSKPSLLVVSIAVVIESTETP